MHPSVHDIARQVAWEEEGVRRAVERYREAEKSADPMNLSPGRALVRGVVKPLIQAIKVKQDEAAVVLSGRGRSPEWARPIQVLDPETTAVITLNVSVRAVCGQQKTDGASMAAITNLSLRLAEALRDQLEFERWEDEEKVKDAAAKEAQEPAYRSRLKALRLTYPTMDRRTWARWCAKMELARNGDNWDKETKIALGAMLLHLLVTVAPEKFLLEERRVRIGHQNTLGVTAETRAVLDDIRERAEVARPLLMPMIIPPLPWRYET